MKWRICCSVNMDRDNMDNRLLVVYLCTCMWVRKRLDYGFGYEFRRYIFILYIH